MGTIVGAPSIDVLHLDEHVVVVNKPSGLAVHKGWAKDPHYALTLTRDRLGRWVYPVHRLDRATSGALIFALDPEVAARVQEAFRERRVSKRYLALVRSIPPEEGTIDRPLDNKEGGEAQPARTDFRRLWVFRDRYALVEARPHTGRLHQIRRHLRGRSCPIIGDVRYGDGKENRWFRSEYGLHRLALHAAEIALPHPATGEELRVRAPMPDDLRGPLREMGAPQALLA